MLGLPLDKQSDWQRKQTSTEGVLCQLLHHQLNRAGHDLLVLGNQRLQLPGLFGLFGLLRLEQGRDECLVIVVEQHFLAYETKIQVVDYADKQRGIEEMLEGEQPGVGKRQVTPVDAVAVQAGIVVAQERHAECEHEECKEKEGDVRPQCEHAKLDNPIKAHAGAVLHGVAVQLILFDVHSFLV